MSPLFYDKQKKMGIAIYVCITFVRHNIIKSALQTIYDQQSARSTSSILNCSEASLGYRPLFTGGLCDFFFCFVQFLQADHLILGILQSQMGVCVHGHSDVRMAHQVLQCLWIHAGAGHIAAVGVAADIPKAAILQLGCCACCLSNRPCTRNHPPGLEAWGMEGITSCCSR